MTIQVARVIGILASLGTVCLWLVLNFANPYGYQGSTQESFTSSLIMTLLAIAGIVVAWTANPYLMRAVFIVSFFPIGFYMLGTPGIFRWIGIFNLLFFIASLPVLVRRVSALAERITGTRPR